VEKEKNNVSTAVHLEKVEGGENQLEKIDGGDNELEKVEVQKVDVVLSKVHMWTKYLYYFILLTLWKHQNAGLLHYGVLDCNVT
jgi:hypothetical protein